jgi:ABC-type lipoprotein release transport system permease subunit
LGLDHPPRRRINFINIFDGIRAKTFHRDFPVGLWRPTVRDHGAALAAGTAIRSLLYGISPQDPKSLIIAMIFVALTAAAGTIFPAVRAARVDPMVALRYE